MHWRYTALYPVFFGVDARIVVLLLVFFFHISWALLWLTAAGFAVLFIAARYGLNTPGGLRWIRSFFSSNDRPAIPACYRRRSRSFFY